MNRHLWLLFLVLTSCSTPDSAPPSISISSPAVGQTVSGTVQVQLNATDTSGITKVSLFARGKGTTGDGVFVGSATSEPFVVSWFTLGFPNQAELELYAKAEDGSGNFSKSDPVWVKINNAGSPTFSYLIGYTLSPVTGVQRQTQNAERQIPNLPNPMAVNPPAGWSESQASAPGHPGVGVEAQADPQRSFVLRFGWNAVAGAAGYRVWQSDKDLAGPYVKVRQPLAVGTGIQEYTPTLKEAKPGDKHWGAITAIFNSSEGHYSNADDTTLLPAQTTSSPAQDVTVSSNRPTLSWNPTEGAQGYLFYVSRKGLAEATPADWVCTNYPNSSDKLEASYPSACPALASGSYYWWVAGVSFNHQAVVDAYSFSDAVRFVVP